MPTASTLFALMAIGKPEILKSAFEEKYSNEALDLGPGEWLIVRPSTTTTIELSTELGITDGSKGAAIVLSVSSYYGRAQPSIWEWIAAKTGQCQMSAKPAKETPNVTPPPAIAANPPVPIGELLLAMTSTCNP